MQQILEIEVSQDSIPLLELSNLIDQKFVIVKVFRHYPQGNEQGFRDGFPDSEISLVEAVNHELEKWSSGLNMEGLWVKEHIETLKNGWKRMTKVCMVHFDDAPKRTPVEITFNTDGIRYTLQFAMKVYAPDRPWLKLDKDFGEEGCLRYYEFNKGKAIFKIQGYKTVLQELLEADQTELIQIMIKRIPEEELLLHASEILMNVYTLRQEMMLNDQEYGFN